MRKTCALTLAVLLLALLPGGPAAAADAPKPAAGRPKLDAAEVPVRSLYDVLLTCMKQAKTLGFDGRVKHVRPALEQTYDFPYMAQKSLGRYWQTLDAKQKSRWVDAFRRMTVYTYATRFDGFSGEKLEVLGAEPSLQGTVIVRTRIVPTDDKPVDINYRMHQVDGHWKAIDAYMDGAVSELALRRSEYTSAFRQDGFDKLVETIQEKAKKKEAKGGT